jgi:hypothetical protein
MMRSQWRQSSERHPVSLGECLVCGQNQCLFVTKKCLLLYSEPPFSHLILISTLSILRRALDRQTELRANVRNETHMHQLGLNITYFIERILMTLTDTDTSHMTKSAVNSQRFRSAIMAHLQRNIVLRTCLMQILRETLLEYMCVDVDDNVNKAKCWTLFVAYIISSLKTTQLTNAANCLSCLNRPSYPTKRHKNGFFWDNNIKRLRSFPIRSMT